MNISGILVVAKTEQFDEVVAALATFEGVEVHQTDRDTGKIVITQEAETIKDEADHAELLKTIPGVITVNMVYHYFADDPQLQQPFSDDVPPIYQS
jgi:nitrate reductase NapAB chaperone NapD